MLRAFGESQEEGLARAKGDAKALRPAWPGESRGRNPGWVPGEVSAFCLTHVVGGMEPGGVFSAEQLTLTYVVALCRENPVRAAAGDHLGDSGRVTGEG